MEQVGVSLQPSVTMRLNTDNGPVVASLLHRTTRGRILIPVKEHIKREIAEQGNKLAHDILASHLNPDEPFRYEFPNLPPMEAKEIRPGYARTSSYRTRRPYRTWGRR
jgi:hypothetical protein